MNVNQINVNEVRDFLRYTFDKKEILPENVLAARIQAAAAVLIDIDLYLTGTKKMSEGDRQAIISKTQEILKEQNIIEIYLDKRFTLFTSELQDIQTRPVAAAVVDVSQARDIDYYQTLSTRIAYMDLQEDELIGGPNPGSTYVVNRIIENEKGLKLYILTPTHESDLPPVVCCKGTDPSNPHNIIDDFISEGIGSYGLEDADPAARTRSGILSEMLRLTRNYGPVIITGHSLGGAVAQQIAAKCVSSVVDQRSVIKAVYCYSAPGVGSKVASDYQRAVTQLSAMGISKPLVVLVRHASDLVTTAGGSYLPADQNYVLGQTSWVGVAFRCQEQFEEAHFLPLLASHYEYKATALDESYSRRALKSVIEAARSTIVGPVVIKKMITRIKDSERERISRIKLERFISDSVPQRKPNIFVNRHTLSIEVPFDEEDSISEEELPPPPKDED